MALHETLAINLGLQVAKLKKYMTPKIQIAFFRTSSNFKSDSLNVRTVLLRSPVERETAYFK